MSVLQQNMGKENALTQNSLLYLKATLDVMGNKEAITRVHNIITNYESSLNADTKEKEQEIIEEQQYTKAELEEQLANKLKLEALQKNAKYEYNIQVVMDTPEGGADLDMLTAYCRFRRKQIHTAG